MTNRVFRFSICTLNQWALDFKGNLRRIIKSIEISKSLGSKYCLFPELSITSYGCEDHFHEPDTILHSWEAISDILKHMHQKDEYKNIICDIGAPVFHKKKIYNCRIIILNSDIIFIRPKIVLPNEGLHRESRWFHPWNRSETDYLNLPDFVKDYTKSKNSTVPFGNFLINFTRDNFRIGLETCEELWSEDCMNQSLYENGAHIIMNASASHHEIRKLDKRVELVCSTTKKFQDCYYAYANLIGCDAQRIAYDGSSMVSTQGKLIMIEKQFSLDEFIISKVEIDAGNVINKHPKSKNDIPTIDVDFEIVSSLPAKKMEFIQDYGLIPEREIALMPSLWLWDIIRRTKTGGFFLCLSGGIDSASVAMIVYNLSKELYKKIVKENDSRVKQEVYDACGFPLNFPLNSEKDICNKLLTTCYMKTKNNSIETAKNARLLAEHIGSNHLEVSIDDVCQSFMETATRCLNVKNQPKFATQGGTKQESLILQNPQARSRMALAYLLAQMIPWYDKLKRGKLILGSSNLDETLRGYLTKYDCSSSDLNPIGSISKEDIRAFIKNEMEIASQEKNTGLQKVLKDILKLKPSAELEPPQGSGEIQSDETDMGLTYKQLSLFGRLRKENKLGPYLMFREILDNGKFSPEIFPEAPKEDSPDFPIYIGDKVKHFFRHYAINRHKTTVLTPAYHAEAYNADDNRFDLRPFIYPVNFDFQFSRIDEHIKKMQQKIK